MNYTREEIEADEKQAAADRAHASKVYRALERKHNAMMAAWFFLLSISLILIVYFPGFWLQVLAWLTIGATLGMAAVLMYFGICCTVELARSFRA